MTRAFKSQMGYLGIEMRNCNKCKEDKPLEDFHKCKAFPLGRVYTCKPCARKKSINWNKDNKDKKSEQGKTHYKKNKDVYLKRAKDTNWQAHNQERIRELSKSRYAKNNGASKVAYYKNLRRKATPNWLTSAQIVEIDMLYWLCRDLEVISGDKYHVDHIVPIKGENICGLHVPWNLQILPADLNIAKSNTFGY